jgi:NadR type nicotinamide-nucleotide adenylyltransferase
MSPKKIAIIGPESTGKTKLAKHLAAHFKTNWVPEFARDYLLDLDRPYEKKDLLEIAKGQMRLEDEMAEKSSGLLICDTNLIVLKIWSDNSYGETDPWILEQLKTRHYDFHLLTNVDIPWVHDPLREHPNMREHFFEKYRQYLSGYQIPFEIVSGDGESRKQAAVRLLENGTF